jgi:pimeloyl-ACP methyl ester carboxylesterase
LLHGITTYSFLWRNIAPTLAEHYDVIAADLLGCGDSDKPLDVSYSLESHARRFDAFLDVLELPKAHLVGHDLGGGIGQIMAVKYPTRIATLSVINSVAFDFWPVQPILAMRTPVIRQLLMATLDWGAFRAVVKRGVYHKERVTPELMELFFKPMRTSEGRKGFLHFAQSLDNANLTSIAFALSKLEIPTLILRGDADLYLGARNSEKLHETIPGSKFARISTAGHFIQEDEPEWVTQQLLYFIGESLARGR